jgi:hypothetical protein
MFRRFPGIFMTSIEGWTGESGGVGSLQLVKGEHPDIAEIGVGAIGCLQAVRFETEALMTVEIADPGVHGVKTPPRVSWSKPDVGYNTAFCMSFHH